MPNCKLEHDMALFARVLYPRHVVIATCVDGDGRANIIPLSFSMPVSYDPPKVVISVGLTKYSHNLIHEAGEYVLNVPTEDLAVQARFCGTVSGREYDKFSESGLTAVPSQRVKSPLIAECVAHLECQVSGEMTAGDHTLFVGDVVAAWVNEGYFDYQAGFPNPDSFTPLFAPMKV